MAVRIRMKKTGRKNRPFFRICATQDRNPRDGKVIEELGYYDPMVKETDARAILKRERIDYWLSVGAQPSDKVGVLIKKYGSQGTHLVAQQAALERLKVRPAPPPPVPVEIPKPTTAKAVADSREAAESEADTAEEMESSGGGDE